MTGQGPFVQLPQTIPAFQPVLPLYIPQDVDVTAIKAQVAAVGVSAPPTAMPGLVDVVNHAHAACTAATSAGVGSGKLIRNSTTGKLSSLVSEAIS